MVEEVEGTWVGIVVVVEVVDICEEVIGIDVVVDIDEGMERDEGMDIDVDVEVEVETEIISDIVLLVRAGDSIEGDDDVVKTTEEEDMEGRPWLFFVGRCNMGILLVDDFFVVPLFATLTPTTKGDSILVR